jgi:glycolate oxidase FAD binding subunit
MSEPAYRPGSEPELCEAVAEAAAAGARLAIQGGGSKSDLGRPIRDARVLDMRGFTGVVDYDPPELVLTVRPGTPLSEVQALVAAQGQMLAFEPFDHGPVFGRPPGAATIGGVVAAGVSGSQRLALGGARDHLLGLRGVSGRGEAFVSGAKVVKNVTGYDLPKLMAGSWGRLAAVTELTLKVLPAPRVTATRILTGLAPEAAIHAMAAALGSQAEVAAAAHLPGPAPTTAFRIQGFAASVAARCEALGRTLAAFGALHDPGVEGAAIWEALRTLDPLAGASPLWRINVPPSQGAEVVTQLEAAGARWMLDWAGGLAWVALDGEPEIVRKAAAQAGGHAQLWRAPEALRAQVAPFHPQPAGLASLEERVRRAFDPNGVFETGRF